MSGAVSIVAAYDELLKKATAIARTYPFETYIDQYSDAIWLEIDGKTATLRWVVERYSGCYTDEKSFATHLLDMPPEALAAWREEWRVAETERKRLARSAAGLRIEERKRQAAIETEARDVAEFQRLKAKFG